MLRQHSSYTLENANNSVVNPTNSQQQLHQYHHQQQQQPHQQNHQVLYHQSQHHHPPQNHHYANHQSMVNTQQYSSVDSQQHHFSKTIDLHKRTTLNYSTTASSSSTSNEMLLDQKYPKYERIYSEPNGSIAPISTASVNMNAVENQFPSKNNHRKAIESSSSTTSSSSAAANTTNANKYENDIVARDTTYQADGVAATPSTAKLFVKQQQSSSENRYGKILQHTRNVECLAKTMPASPRRSRPPTLPSPPPPPPLTGSNYDQFNSNVPYQLKCDNGIITAVVNNCNAINNNNFNNNSTGSSSSSVGRLQPLPPATSSVNNNNHHINSAAAGHNFQRYASHNGNATNGGVHHPSGLVSGGGSVGATANVNPAAPRRSGSETNRNMLRTNRYSNGTHLTAPGGTPHQLAHMINSLSSPESAYSTGYSTDGTSPGTHYLHYSIFRFLT